MSSAVASGSTSSTVCEWEEKCEAKVWEGHCLLSFAWGREGLSAVRLHPHTFVQVIRYPRGGAWTGTRGGIIVVLRTLWTLGARTRAHPVVPERFLEGGGMPCTRAAPFLGVFYDGFARVLQGRAKRMLVEQYRMTATPSPSLPLVPSIAA